MTLLLIDFLQDPQTVRTISEFMLLAVALASGATFLIMATFKGKSFLDWMLQVRELGYVLVGVYLFLVVTSFIDPHPLTRVAVYTFLALVCILVLIALIREHVFYKGAPSLAERWRRFRE